ncbi:mucin-5AC-like [Diceros bicornis minor]|uniref:mucin-5AC-like n=1 Tax=Diceros bicornis minor TaxID=77932 RepID=UPI0026EEE754|nr:mucin-5AC-like [Diceros bicornis minor]
MGVGQRKLAPLWVLALALACAQHTGQAHDGSAEPGYEYLDLPSVHQGPGGGPLRGVTILSSLRTTPVMRAANPAHNGRVCSTWGDFHYKTFDGDVFRFPGLCNYVFSAHCSAAYEDFNVQLRRGRASNATTLNRVVMKLDGMVVELTNSSVLVNGRLIQLPFSQSGVLIEHSSSYVKVVARLGLVFMWNQDDSLLLELDAKYANQTCGLCGDFNGVPVFNEFFSHNVKLTPVEFGNLQKLDGPTEQCQDPIPVSLVNCSTGLGLCEEILSSRPFSGCNALVDASSYVEACHQDLCLCERDNLTSCICHTLAEYSRQCAHAGGLPQDWRGPDLCPLTCPLNMRYRECGSPCSDTCSNREHSQLCEDHCVAGCFCPEGMVLDDIGHTGCIPESHCSCVYNGATYAPGATYSTDCTNCTCSGGQWSCQEVPCPGTCSVLGGAHFSTFDERLYTVHGDCTYVLAKPCNSSAFTVLADLRKCGLTDSETCLKSLTLSLGGGHTVIVIKASGEVFVNQIYTQLPVSAANITLFRPSTFFIIAQTNLDLQLDVQLVPTMQVFVRLAPALQGLTCGLCGNFNQNQADDFRTLSGVVEGTAAAFVNTWKTQAACPNVKNSFEDPCSLSVENEKYAQHWCSRLTDPHGSFSGCHSAVSPSTYYANCMFDTCNCEKSEACMCAALSSYVRACAAKGVLLSDWRDGVCVKPTTTCPKSMTYQYNISTCQPTCRARSEEDVTCGISFVTVDGCACPHDTFLDDTGKCVPATSCPCYLGGSVVPNGESLHESGAICTCTQGRLTCIGGHVPTSVCASPMVYFDCRNATAGASGAGCQKSCHTLDMDCYSSQCVSGCVCPHGLVADGQGGCIAAADCPCVHNDASYQAGETIRVGCNTCTCKNRVWQCTDEPCLATCAVYGDGHYLTFDGQRYSFSGDCEYTLVQDHCSRNSSTQEAFRVVTENVPCGTTGTTCSKAIKIFLGSYELKLSDGKVEVIGKGAGQEVPYSIRQMGIYLVVDTDVGLLLLWDMKTSIFIRLSPEFKGRVCGLCGNFDDNAVNDFTTRSQSVVGNALEFGNSWKFSPSCPDASAPKDPCTANPYRKSWAQKQCSIINSATFAACHAHVEPAKYYEACVSDACACDSGGDCECFCTAVAAYAQACHEVGVCVSWRTPSICPLFCDYYNPEGLCEWHYLPCGAPCLRTCQNPRGQCLHDVSGLEGCYPKCPAEAPLFDEDQMRCVATCPQSPCHVQGKSYQPGAVVPLDENCQSCVCTESGIQCTYDAEACVCTYDGRRFRPGDVIYHTTDGTGGCISARCGANGTIDRRVYTCSSTTPAPQTTFSFSTSPLVVSSTRPPGTHPSPTESTLSSAPPTTVGTSARPTPSTASASPLPDCEDCQWSQWMEVSRLGRGNDSGDFDPLEKLRAHGYQVCQAPRAVQCQAEAAPEVPLQVLGQRVECSPVVGLTCHNRDQASGLCDSYQIRILCCSPLACPTSGGPAQTTPPATSRTTETGPTPGTSRVTSVPTGSTASPAFVSTTGPTTLSTTSKTSAPHTSTTAPRTPTPAPGTSTTAPSTPTSAPGTSTTAYPYTCPSYLYNSPTYPYFCPRYLYNSCKYPYTCPRYLYNSPKYPYFCPRYLYNSCKYPYTCPTYLYNSPKYPYTCPSYLYNSPTYPYFCPRYLYNSCKYPYTCPRYLYNSPSYPYTCPRYLYNSPSYPYTCPRYLYNSTLTPAPGTSTTTPGTPTPGPHTSTTAPGTPTPAPGTSTTAPRTSTRAPGTPGSRTSTPGKTTLSTPSPMPVSTTASTTSSVFTKALGSSEVPGKPTSPEPTNICLQQSCNWTQWIDGSYPGPGRNSGDFDTLQNLRSKGYKFCEKPSNVQCRAESFPDIPLEELGQDVICNTEVGLLCLNKDQLPPICYNYEIRIECCETVDVCRGKTTPPATLETTHSTPHSTGATTQGSGTTAIPSISTKHTRASSAPGLPTTEVAASTPTVTTPETIACRPQCKWTKWFDVELPSPGPQGGENETYSNILRSGERICHRPEYITHLECRAESRPEVSIDQLGQVVQCDPDVGLVCRNQDQEGLDGVCLNYEIRVLCCEPREDCTTQTPVTHPSTSSVSIHSHETTSHVATSRATTLPETSPTSVQETSKTSVPRLRTTTVSATSATSVPRTSKASVPGTSTTSVQETSRTSKPGTSPTSMPGSSPTFEPNIGGDKQDHLCAKNEPNFSAGNQQNLCAETEHNHGVCNQPNLCARHQPDICNLCAKTEHNHSAWNQPNIRGKNQQDLCTKNQPNITHSPPVTNKCRPRCNWTKWFDVELPSPGPQGGENETYSNILRSGERICHRPEYITHLECRAESRPEVSIDQLGQVVQCDPDVGLVCRNQDQEGPDRACLNYEIRVLCCEPREDCTTQTPVTHPSTSSVSIHSHETTSHVAMSRTTTLLETSPTSVQGTSPTSEETTKTTSVPGTSPTSVQETSRTSNQPDLFAWNQQDLCARDQPDFGNQQDLCAETEHNHGARNQPNLCARNQQDLCARDQPNLCARNKQNLCAETELNHGITHSPPVTNKCRPRCNWTKWFDVELPSPGPQGGENETYSNILRSGERICHQPEYITHLECRAESRPEVSIDQLGQVVKCDPDVGLVCRNQDQEGPDRACLNYEIRVLCCEPREDCTTQTPVTHPSTSSVSIHSHETTSHVAMSRTTTLPETSPTSTTSVPGTSPTSVQETSRTSVPRLRTTTVPAPSPTSVQETSRTSVPGTSPSSVQETSRTSVPRLSTTTVPGTSHTSVPGTSLTSVHETSRTSVPRTSPTSVHETSRTSVPRLSTTTGRATSPTSITHSPPVTNKCRPRCNWTKWFDVELPSPGPQGGENETYSNILRSGERICHRPEYITHLECRAESRPEVSIDQLGQVVKCDPDVGLVCRNQDQEGPDRACLNYEIRVLCCEPREDCTTQTPVTHPSTSSVSTRSHKTTSHVATFRITTLPETSPTSVQETSKTSVLRLTTNTVLATSPTSVPGTSPTSEERTKTTSVPGNQQNLCAKTENNYGAWNHPNLCAKNLQNLYACHQPNLCAGNQQDLCPETEHDHRNQQNLCAKTEHNYLAWNQCNLCAGNPQNLCAETENNHGNQQDLCAKTEHNHGTWNQPHLCAENQQDTCARQQSNFSAGNQQNLCISTTSMQETGRTSVSRLRTTTVPRSRPTSVPGTSRTSVPGTSPISVQETSSTAVHRPGTTLAPTISTTSVPAPETTHSPPVTNKCRPRCNWTKWFDVELPSPGPQGGENETYSNILRSGERICHRPEYITHLECRAKSRPEVSTDQLGQVVKCDPDVGLVCRNQDQEGPDRACLNYEIRVLCCEPRDDCTTQTPVTHPSTWSVSTRSHETTSHVASSRTISVLQTSPTSGPGTSPTSLQETSRTSVTPHVTSSTNRSPPPQSTSLAPTVKSLSSPASSPSTCYCNISQKIYPAGSTIYQQTDLDGHCYSAVCSLDCHVVRWSNDTCPTSVSPPAPSTSSPGSSPSAPVPDTKHGCSKFVPPRTKGETWNTPNCTQTTCEGNNVTTVRPRQCPKQQEPTCANGYPAVKVADQDGCCPHYQCQCVCSGWGDPHYITFDGTYYTFLDNCTYVLVQQIVPVYGHFRVLINNYFCDAEDGLSCPQSIIVEYQQDRVVLTRKPVRGVMTNEIIFNGKVVSPGFQKDGIEVSQIGIKMYVTIPAIGVQVMFSGLIFSVEVPFSKFANNTEGQCGTCTNDPKDECRLPGGEVVSSCSEMSGHWKVPNPDQPYCYGPPPTPTAGPTSTPSPASCPPSPICQLILSEVFEPCHSVISPKPFYQGCVFDQCHVPDLDVVCSGLELYASLCASHGMCIDWRGQTNHMCPFTCPADKVYRPCGPSNPSHCYGNDSISLLALQDAGPVTEGCFCPESMMLFSTSVDVCVPNGCPRCLGPHGEPVEPGHNVSIDCQECTCNGSTWRMSCRSQPCPPPPTCSAPGLVPVPAAPEAGQCCPHYSCVCNSSHCPAPLDCPKGSRLILTYEEGACCPRQNCSWTVCSVNGTLYQPGTVVSSNLCETCRCEVPGGAQSDTFVISCETQICNTYCPVGFEYQARSGQCCGVCVQVACFTNASDSSVHLFYPGKSWSDPGDPCVTYECEKYQDGLVVVTTKKACPQLTCPSDQARLSEDGCCLSCPPPQPQTSLACTVHEEHEVIQQQGCNSSGPVRLAYCRGNCGDTTSMYSLEANAVERSCKCCQELRVSLRNVTLHCADGSSRAFSYPQVEECGCVGLHCDSHGDRSEELGPVQSRAEQSQERKQTRQRRGAQGPGPHQ